MTPLIIHNTVGEELKEISKMKTISIVIVLTGLSLVSTIAQESCLDSNRLASVDSTWEKALLESNVEFLKSILTDDFIWVHNHAGLIDSKSSLLKRASDPYIGATGNPKSRISEDVKVRVTGSTGIVTGFTTVDRGPTPTTYYFMRTYAEIDGNCFLLANNTMVIPENED